MRTACALIGFDIVLDTMRSAGRHELPRNSFDYDRRISSQGVLNIIGFLPFSGRVKEYPAPGLFYRRIMDKNDFIVGRQPLLWTADFPRYQLRCLLLSDHSLVMPNVKHNGSL